MTTRNETVAGTLEPFAAAPGRRLEQVAALIDGGIETRVRLDPVIAGLTDDERALDALLAALSQVGVQQVSVSTLFLRPALMRHLRQQLPGPMFERVMAAFETPQRVPMRTGRACRRDHGVVALPQEVRRSIFARIDEIAGHHGIRTRLCACKNPDLAGGTCGIAGAWGIA